MSRVDLEQMAPTGEVLQDRRMSGDLRPWRTRRLQSLIVAQGYRDSGFDRIADSVSECGTELGFAECPHGHVRQLVRANFCRRRLCPMCMWRRSLKLAAQVQLVAHEALAREPGLRYLMVTLTIRNCRGDDLGATITHMVQAHTRMLRSSRFGGRRGSTWLAGWFRALEVTYNQERDDYHPHLHDLIAVRPSYWKHHYMRLDEWRRQWADALGVDYLPLVEVHPVRPRVRRDGTVQTLGGAVAEVTKYATDPGFLSEEWAKKKETTARVVRQLHMALAGRRLTAYGGCLREIYRELLGTGRTQDVEAEDVDLIQVDEATSTCTCPVCSSDLMEHVYRWYDHWKDYVG